MMQGGGRQGEGDSLCLGSLLVAVMEARARPGWSQESGAPIGQLASPSDFLVAASGSWTGTFLLVHTQDPTPLLVHTQDPIPLLVHTGCTTLLVHTQDLTPLLVHTYDPAPSWCTHRIPPC